jgi:adenine-specific DNA-methyltransferase
MILDYSGKRSPEDIIRNTYAAKLPVEWQATDNLLIQGENLQVLKALTLTPLAGQVDLVYIDPPFSTRNVFRVGVNRTATVSGSATDAIAYEDKLTGDEYIEFIRERLILIKELMSDHGSIYVHIDSKMVHYVKIIMDEVFGRANFRSDITRVKCNPKNFKRRSYGNIKDVILFYTKTNTYIWNEPRIARESVEIARLFKKTDAAGRKYTTSPLHAPGETKNGPTGQSWRGISPPRGRHWRYDPKVLEELNSQGLIEWSLRGIPRKIIYAEDFEHKKPQDIWEFKDAQYPDYPTQKNLEMLELIVGASSNPGSIVLDCFCGSGTTMVAAGYLGRKWVGIDRSVEAIRIARQRLMNNGTLPAFNFIKASVPKKSRKSC